MLVVLMVATMTSPLTDEMLPPLAPAEAAAVRAGVYGKGVATACQDEGFRKVVVIVPQAVRAAFRKNPAAARELLGRIADGAGGEDSVAAASYAIELATGPGAGVFCSRLFKSASYDTVDATWKQTPREHWVQMIRDEVAKHR